MKSNKILWLTALALIILIAGCSKDLGNYDYKEINSFKIAGLKSGSDEADRTYFLSLNDTLVLHPDLSSSIGNFNPAEYEFSWIINEKEVAKTKDLSYLANKEFGLLKATYKVKSKASGLERIHNFFLNISQPFKYGYFVLTQAADKSTHIYCKSAIKANMPLQEIKISSIPDLGSEPIAFAGIQQDNFEKRYYKMMLTSKKAKYPIVMFDSRTFNPILLYNNENYVGDAGTFNFEPEYVRYDDYQPIIYAINKGKMHVLNSGGISLPLMGNDAMDYAISKNGLSSSLTVSSNLNIFFDSKNQRMRAWAVKTGGPYDFQQNYDQVLNPLDLSGHEYLRGQLAVVNNAIGFYFLSRKGNSLFSYRIKFNGLTPASFELIKEIPYNADIPISQVYYDVQTNFWYLASKKTIYRCSALGLDLQAYITLPATAKGEIARFHYAAGNNSLLIGTTDKSMSSGKNSSIYIYNTASMEQAYKEELVLEEIKDVFAGL